MSLGGTVDFVGENDIGEDRPLNELETAVFVKYFTASDIRRHKVGGELDAVEREAEGFCQCIHHHGLGKSRNTDQKAVATGEYSCKKSIDSSILADDDLGYFGFQTTVVVS